MTSSTATRSDLETLAALNDTYIRCVVEADTRRFAEILADDFVCSNPDASIVDKPAFLRQIERIGKFRSMETGDVRIRVIGADADVALIHATTTFVMADGRTGRGRYTDGWAKRGGQWVAVFAHVTRL
ncbi:MAG TPA: nuclear transport factor 2 family protein [Vicinamibacterales bacterium]|nr:nuclear transport factor 2 family protein [Vicinamibacterales bacterium]